MNADHSTSKPMLSTAQSLTALAAMFFFEWNHEISEASAGRTGDGPLGDPENTIIPLGLILTACTALFMILREIFSAMHDSMKMCWTGTFN